MAALQSSLRDEEPGWRRFPALKYRATLRASLRDDGGAAAGEVFGVGRGRWVRDSPHCGRRSRKINPWKLRRY